MFKGESKLVRTSDFESASEVWFVADHDFSCAVVIANQSIIDKVYFTVFSNDSHTVSSGPDGLSLNWSWEWSWQKFRVHSTVKYFSRVGPQDETVCRNFKVLNFIAVERMIIDFCKNS